MLYMWEFEIFENGKFVSAFPADDLGEGTFGTDFDDAVESAVDWLTMTVDDALIHGKELPKPRFDNEPVHGGRMVVIAVTRELSDIPSVSPEEAAAELGIAEDRVLRLIDDCLLEAWSEDGRLRITRGSVDARLEYRDYLTCEDSD